MVRDRRKYAFNPSKIRFRLNIKLPINTTGKSKKRNYIKKMKRFFLGIEPVISQSSPLETVLGETVLGVKPTANLPHVPQPGEMAQIDGG
jgi:hypothetical protein